MAMATAAVDSAIDWQLGRQRSGDAWEDRAMQQQDGDVEMEVDDQQLSPNGHRPDQQEYMRKSPLGQQKRTQTLASRHNIGGQQQRLQLQLFGSDQQANIRYSQQTIPRSHPDPDLRPSSSDIGDHQHDSDNDVKDHTLIYQRRALSSSDIELDGARDDPSSSASPSKPRKSQEAGFARFSSAEEEGEEEEFLVRTEKDRRGSINKRDSAASGKVTSHTSQGLAKGRGKRKGKTREISISASSPSNTHRSPSSSTLARSRFAQAVPPDHHHYSPKLHRFPHNHGQTHTHLHADTASPAFTCQSQSLPSTGLHQSNGADIINAARTASSFSTAAVPIHTPTNTHRPDPLRIASSSSSASASSSLRSARRLTHSPYLVPQTARFMPSRVSLSPNMVAATPTPMITVKDEPHTPVPLPTSPDGMADQEATFDLQRTPQQQQHRSLHSPGSRIGSSPGSMSMSQRRGVKPSFPGARVPSRGAPATRELPTPLYSASSRQPPYPSPVPLLTAPLSPTNANASRWHQSAPAVPMTAFPTKTPHQPNPYQVSLDEIPKDFVLKKLVQLASKYWYAPHSADCHIIVPIRRQSSTSTQVPTTPRTAVPSISQRQRQNIGPQPAGAVHHDASQPGSSFWGPPQEITSDRVKVEPGSEEDVKPDVLTSSVKTTAQGVRDPSARRGSLPGDNQLEQCLVFPLHKDYLTTQSVLFRTLLNSQAAQISNPPPRDDNGRLLFQSPVIRGAKVLPTRADRPKALYVPLPDPASFGVILHWLYWHDADHFNHCLSKGLVTWQGVIRNIEYLSLDNEIKLLAGKWWKRWVKPTEPTERTKTGPASVKGFRASGKKRAMSVSTGLKKPINRGGADEDDDDEEEDEDGNGIGIDSGDEADEEDLEVDGAGVGKASVIDDSFADHVSARFGRL